MEKKILDSQVDLSAYDSAAAAAQKVSAAVEAGNEETLAAAKSYADTQAAAALQGAKEYTAEEIGKLNYIKFVDSLPQTGESKYIYAVVQDERTPDDEAIVLLFVWTGTEFAAVGVMSGAVDVSVFQPYVDAAQAAQTGAETAQTAAESARDAAQSAQTAAEAAQGAAESAQTAAETAKGQAENFASSAQSAATAAQTSADSADTFAQAASSSQQAAAGSATAASASADLAQEWATQTDAEVVSGQGYGAKYYADQAADSASSANTSASTATTKATEASASASQASQSAIDAANSAASARGLQIGAVYFSQSSLATDNPGGLPLWKGEYFSNASSLYPDFYAWVKSHTELCKTKTEYDAAISTYGECPYYVVDEVEGSLRLPKLANYLKMANTTDGITQAQAGVPNITGTLRNCQMDNTNATGAFKSTGSDNWGGSNSGYPRGSVDFSAARSSAVYGRSSTVTPAHTTVFPWVYAFNSAVSASEAQAAEFTGALSGKANTDLSNVSSNIDYVVESKAATDTDPSWYRIYKSGWIEQGGSVYVAQDSSAQVNLLKPFSNGNYFVAVTYINNKIPTNADRCIWNRTTTQFTMYCYCLAGNKLWYACGQGA